MPVAIEYRWIDGATSPQAEWDEIDGMLAARGWMSLNRGTSRILVEEQDGRITGLSVLQLLPSAGPLLVVPAARGRGTAEALADRTLAYLIEVQARGWIVVADSPFTERLCVERGMKRLDSPVYVTPSDDKKGG